MGHGPGSGQRIRGGADLDLVWVLRGSLILQRKGMISLPEVVIMDDGVEPERGGVGTVTVTQLEAGVQWQCIFHFQVHVNGARFIPLGQRRGHLDVCVFICLAYLLLNIGGIEDRAGLHRWKAVQNLFRRYVAVSNGRQFCDFTLGHVEPDDPFLDPLLGNADQDRRIPFGMIEFLQGVSRRFNVGRLLVRDRSWPRACPERPPAAEGCSLRPESLQLEK